jgi:hypothetical protein
MVLWTPIISRNTLHRLVVTETWYVFCDETTEFLILFTLTSAFKGLKYELKLQYNLRLNGRRPHFLQ